MFEFHTILGYPDGKSLFTQWKEKEMSHIKQEIGEKIALAFVKKLEIKEEDQEKDEKEEI
jgi:hypothetical protein